MNMIMMKERVAASHSMQIGACNEIWIEYRSK